MAGNPTNVSLWDEADVWALFPEDIAPGSTIADYLPATADDPFAAPWQLVGLLDGGQGFEESRSRDNTSHAAWGVGRVIQSFKDFEMERKLTALEDNPTTARLKSANDTDDDVVVSTHTPAYLAFETRDRRGKKRRRITRRPADVVYEGSTENDSDLDSAEFTASIYPDGKGRLLRKQDENNIVADPDDDDDSLDFLLTITATGGTFTFTYRGQPTAPIAFDATNSAIKAALVALDDGFKAADWAVAGSPTVVTVPRAGALTVDASSLTGGTATIAPA